MKLHVSGAVALIAASLPLAAQAADMNYGARAPYTVNQPLNAFSWAGPYLGGNLGYAWGSVDNNPTKPSGFVGGVQGGYNWQSGPWVFGVEADIQATGANDTFAPWKFSNPWFGTVRGRVGYAFNNVCLYRHRRSGVRRIARRDLRPVGDPYQSRLDRGRRRRIRPDAELDARRSNISMSISTAPTSPSPAHRTATASAWCAPA